MLARAAKIKAGRRSAKDPFSCAERGEHACVLFSRVCITTPDENLYVCMWWNYHSLRCQLHRCALRKTGRRRRRRLCPSVDRFVSSSCSFIVDRFSRSSVYTLYIYSVCCLRFCREYKKRSMKSVCSTWHRVTVMNRIHIELCWNHITVRNNFNQSARRKLHERSLSFWILSIEIHPSLSVITTKIKADRSTETELDSWKKEGEYMIERERNDSRATRGF